MGNQQKNKLFLRYVQYTRYGIGFLMLVIVVAGLHTISQISFAKTIAAKQTAPRLSNYYLSWTLNEAVIKELAKWDMVVIDIENQAHNPEMIKALRRLNPDILILAYLPAQEVYRSLRQFQGAAQVRSKLYAGIQDEWWLKTVTGSHAVFWPRTWLLNVSFDAPRANGQRWIDYLSSFVVNDILSTDLWDGVFYDNTWDNIMFIDYNIDRNRDGQMDGWDDTNAAWKKGMSELFTLTRQKYGKDVILFGNGDIFLELNGVLLEGFPRAGWSETMRKYQRSIDESFSPSIGLLNANTHNTGNRDDYQLVRFTYGSSLLSDGYYSFDYGDWSHEQTWWYDEYDVALGKPLKAAMLVGDEKNSTPFRSGVWRRDYEGGVVVVNETTSKQDVGLGGEFEHIKGKQDTAANSGLIVDRVTLAPQDARILLRPVTELRGRLFQNGSFVRVLDANGQPARNGFFSFEKKFDGGTPLLVTDFDNGSIDEIVGIFGPEVRVYTRGYWNIRSSFYPYGEQYKGEFDLAVGDLDGDGYNEIVTVNLSGRPEVRVFSIAGETVLKGVFPFGVATGGAHIALGNIDGKLGDEMVVAERGKGSRVQLLTGKGERINGFLRPLGVEYKGGFDVALGDVSGDSRTELIVAPLDQKKRMVQLYDSKQLVFISSFELPDGVRGQRSLDAVDIDGDGRAEIVVFGQ